ncbi:winged helix-turn-helix transcriptional regulator [Carboxylicivirga taeanensis]|uniref:winged helix-turn-helix transcriptional regulator n=1 Tax=Carboxylicivirga taeanensis TaxID=1416875 RepID=UPI003F6DD32D
MKKQATINNSSTCKTRIQAITDTMSLLSGKWKFHIVGTLIEGHGMGFMDLMREVDGIGTKMLSKELQDLEMNQLISRTVRNTKPVTVEYSITDYGKTLEPIIDAIANWGITYRKSISGQGNESCSV